MLTISAPSNAIASSTSAKLLEASLCILDYPFGNRIYPGALDVIGLYASWGPHRHPLPTAMSSSSPKKVERSGLSEAVEGCVLIYIHKEEALDEVMERYRAAM